MPSTERPRAPTSWPTASSFRGDGDPVTDGGRRQQLASSRTRPQRFGVDARLMLGQMRRQLGQHARLGPGVQVGDDTFRFRNR